MSYDILPVECRLAMRMLIAPKSINTVMTSPPYFGLRDYNHVEQIGLGSTIENYVDSLVDVFSHVRNILQDDGTIWLNIGDSYSGSGKGAWDIRDEEKLFKGVKESYRPNKNPSIGRYTSISTQRSIGHDRNYGLKPKNLMGIPWRVALALQSDGWYIRQDIIWNKPNCKPESVIDRFNTSHEYVFLLSKSKRYYFNSDAAKEQGVSTRRIKRSVWDINTVSLKNTNFATFPPALVEPCILAGCPVGGTVFDPFGGSGTTAMVAERLQRNSILCEINPDYVQLAHDRIHRDRIKRLAADACNA